ncbi:MAG TPA: DUF1707 domain-containing protein [Jiangellaceae bacterium]|nr:DUF1707 domain-containing protein [Jiangellaceae bacterium]
MDDDTRDQPGADLRCSDTDRERVAEAIRAAAAEGRLTLTELEERLDLAFKAKTYADLQPITADLPQGPYPIPGQSAQPVPPATHDGGGTPVAGPTQSQPPAQPGSPKINAFLSTEKRAGRWTVPQRMDVTAILGEVVLDFTEAVVSHSDVHVQLGVLLGEVTMIVPEGANVVFEEATNVLGEQKSKLTQPPTPGAPVIHVHGLLVLGEVKVRPPREGITRGVLGQ